MCASEFAATKIIVALSMMTPMHVERMGKEYKIGARDLQNNHHTIVVNIISFVSQVRLNRGNQDNKHGDG